MKRTRLKRRGGLGRTAEQLVRLASGLAESAQEQIDNIGSTVGVLGHSIADTAASFSEKTVTGVSFMRSLMDTIAIIREYIALRKENS